MHTDLAKLQRSPQEVARWQKAQQQTLSGRHGPALAGYRDLLKRFPGVAQLWFELGIAAAGELDYAQADQAFQRVTELASGDADMLVLTAQQYHRLRRLDAARDCFQRAVAADPNSVSARVSLADWLERERRLDDAWECMETCVARHPQDGQARYFRAFLLHRKGRNEEAETALRDLVQSEPRDPNVRCSSRHLLGVVLDALGQYPEAMRWLCEAKALVRHGRDTATLEKDYDRMDRQRRDLLAALTPETIQRWRQEARATPVRHRVAFLGGHPRSGTTLVEQILGAHPDILAFDESEAFVHEIANAIAAPQSAKALTADTLNSLNAAWRANLNERYFKSLLRETREDPGTRMLLDKNPSATASLPLWLRIFPDLKVVIPLRDPRDTVISCFFQNLMLTMANVNFLSLERAARHYADLMDVWLRMRELGGFDWIETRYEDVVSNLESEGRRVTEFVGLPWHPDQAAFHETARKKVLFAPTYNDVTQPVHNHAVKRWEHYAGALEPIQSRLAHYCRAFGYAG